MFKQDSLYAWYWGISGVTPMHEFGEKASVNKVVSTGK